jgi:cobalamin biosynthesis protein CobW
MNSHAQALVVSGFLGSGKTTLVRRLLEDGQRRGIRTAVVSNEFGELGIDEALLAGTAQVVREGGIDFVELAGGCVCCRLSDDLLKTLQELWEKSRPERVIVETSGVALPYDTLINFWRDPVRAWAVDESSVVVVSAEQVATGRDLDRTFEDQVCSTDLVILSKTDLLGEVDAARAEARVRRMQPDVTIVRASFGNVDPNLFFPPEPGSASAREDAREGGREYARASAHDAAAQAGEVHDHGAHMHDEYRCQELAFEAGIRGEAVQRVLEERAALRAKGFVDTDEGLRIVQGVAGRIELSKPHESPPAHLVGRVVVIERRPRGDAWQIAGANLPGKAGANMAGAAGVKRKDA